MAMKKIPKRDQILINACAFINNFKRVVEELVYNSLDAGSSSIAIRVNIHESFVQVLDNGNGILENDLQILGQKYATSKYIDIANLKSAPGKYGFRGLSLANIINVSQDVKIISRHEKSNDTWLKTFSHSKEKEICKTVARPSKGTTVEITGFLYNLNIQRKLIEPHNELQTVKITLQQIALIHCAVSISLRDDSKNVIIFQMHKNRNVYNTIGFLFQVYENDIQELQIEKNEYKAKAFISKNTQESSINYQWIYLNGRFISQSVLHQKINKYLTKSNNLQNCFKRKNKRVYEDENRILSECLPFYFIFVSCPIFDVDITYDAEKSLIEFKDWREIDKLLQKLVQFYYGELILKPQENEMDKIRTIEKNNDIRSKVKEITDKILNNKNKQLKTSQLHNGVKGKIHKRKQKQKDDILLTKSSSIKLCTEAIDPFNLITSPKVISHEINQATGQVLLEQETFTPKCNELVSVTAENKTLLIEKKDIKKKLKRKQILQNIFYPNLTIDKKFKIKILRRRCKYLKRQLQNIKKEFIKRLQFKDTSFNLRERNDYAAEYLKINSKSKISYKDHEKKSKTLNHQMVKKSYELIKTVINSQYNVCEISPVNEKDAINEDQTVAKCSDRETFLSEATYDSHSNVLNVRKRIKTNNFTSTRLNNNLSTDKENLITLKDRTSFSKYQIDKTKEKAFKNNLQDVCNEELHRYSYTIELKDMNDKNIGRITTSKTNLKQSIINNSSTNTTKRCNHSKLINLSDIRCLEGTIPCTSLLRNNPLNNTYTLKAIETQTYTSCYFEDMQPSILKQSADTEKSIHKIDTMENFSFISENCESKNVTRDLCIEPIHYCETLLDNSNEITDLAKEFENSFLIPTSNYNFYCKRNNDDNNLSIVKGTKVCIESLKNNVNNSLNDSQKNQLQPKEKSDIEMTENDQMYGFRLKGRHHFMPKGLSPITKNVYSRNRYFFNSGEEYYKDMIYKNFANDVLVHSEIYEPLVQNLKNPFSKNKKEVDVEVKTTNGDLIFDAQSLRHAKVLGQVDCKFIAVILTGGSLQTQQSSNLFVLFDQHAVDERIRLESNLSDYIQDCKWKSVNLDPVSIFLTKADYLYFFNYQDKLTPFGLQWTLKENNEILLSAIPKAVMGQHPRQVEIVMKAVKKLILEQIKAMKSLKGNVSLYPKAIMDLVFSEACRYAIKFGDKLTKNECISLINSLALCKIPFQCAHGRPVMAVIIELKNNTRSYKVNLSAVRRFKKSHDTQ